MYFLEYEEWFKSIKANTSEDHFENEYLINLMNIKTEFLIFENLNV